ncbi:alpha/beta hydrolase [Rhodococcus sp. ABRD24]|uniref:alpha/beta fold hydrolase n=1 Tax=Rhodococcus sp. ABRD24 TaxID=2507582 RepID=UPI00103B16AF|nr:alpha/beta hydrolase [Rhodococcus sp. ABRD24]QBJ98271.1 alpha/beta hydrolase [Rhodococcus sp. ABRD24]
MQQQKWSSVAVVLPGTGSDADFADRAFNAPLAQVGVQTIAVEPDPRRVVDSYREAMERAARTHGRILVGGVSIGAAVALSWAAENPDRVGAVMAALPPWTGSPRDAPAAASARFTATQLRAHGLDAVTSDMTASSPAWLADELSRSWRSQWPDLPAALDEAAGYHALDEAALARIRTPVGIAAAVDDAVHPITVAEQWAAMLPNAELSTLELREIGADPGVLGRACLAALDRLRGPRP